MIGSQVHFIWRNPPPLREFRTGVSLHGHTMHSQECLSFLPRYLHQIPGVSQMTRHYERPIPGSGPAVDFAPALESGRRPAPRKGTDRRTRTSSASLAHRSRRYRSRPGTAGSARSRRCSGVGRMDCSVWGIDFTPRYPQPPAVRRTLVAGRHGGLHVRSRRSSLAGAVELSGEHP
jgi:hypothetical protein